MLIPLSFKIIIIFVLLYPRSFKASRLIPLLILPSPITLTTLYFSFFMSLALAKPSAADIEVLLCPVSKKSYLLSFGYGNPLKPLYFLRVSKFFLLPVSIL